MGGGKTWFVPLCWFLRKRLRVGTTKQDHGASVAHEWQWCAAETSQRRTFSLDVGRKSGALCAVRDALCAAMCAVRLAEAA